MSSDEEILETVGRNFLRKYWKMTIVMVLLMIVAIAEALFVFLWVLGDMVAQTPILAFIGDWSVGAIITLVLRLLFWELILVGLWVIVAAALLYLMWYNNLPEEDKFPKKERGRREEGDAFGFFIGIVWLIIIWFTDRWERPFSAWDVTDWVFSWLWAVFWVLVIIGIPVLLYFVYWIRKEP